MSRLFFASEIKIYAVPVSVYSKTITRGRESGLAKPPVCNCVDKLGTQKQTDPTLFVFDCLHTSRITNDISQISF